MRSLVLQGNQSDDLEINVRGKFYLRVIQRTNLLLMRPN